MMRAGEKKRSEKMVQYKNGKIYFSRVLERKVFFILTVMMLLWGLFTRAGLM